MRQFLKKQLTGSGSKDWEDASEIIRNMPGIAVAEKTTTEPPNLPGHPLQID